MNDYFKLYLENQEYVFGSLTALCSLVFSACLLVILHRNKILAKEHLTPNSSPFWIWFAATNSILGIVASFIGNTAVGGIYRVGFDKTYAEDRFRDCGLSPTTANSSKSSELALIYFTDCLPELRFITLMVILFTSLGILSLIIWAIRVSSITYKTTEGGQCG